MCGQKKAIYYDECNSGFLLLEADRSPTQLQHVDMTWPVWARAGRIGQKGWHNPARGVCPSEGTCFQKSQSIQETNLFYYIALIVLLEY